MKKLSKFFCIILSLALLLPIFTSQTFADQAGTSYIAGDVDKSGQLDNADAIYLLYNTIFGNETYPISQTCDFDSSGSVNNADAIYLLYHVIFPEAYPLPEDQPSDDTEGGETDVCDHLYTLKNGTKCEYCSNINTELEVLDFITQTSWWENSGFKIGLHRNGEFSVKNASPFGATRMVNLGFVNNGEGVEIPDCTIHMKSMTFSTSNGDVTVKIDAKLRGDYANGLGNGLANIWGGFSAGDVAYGTETDGLVFVSNSSGDGIEIALMVGGVETSFDSITYNFEILDLENVNDNEEDNNMSKNVYKSEETANPISGSIFCADPTAVEYNGRLYVYGTNDHEQADNSDHNSYEYIKSLVVFSTDDMVNWTYHGTINVGEIAPWIYNSWAPSICSRVEEDGLTHFYLYFSNSGAGVGVITSTDPVTGWTDPLGKPLVYQGMPGLENCPAPFDPGVCIDENGVGWLSFGGGAPGNGVVHSYVPKIARLGEDMLSFDSEFVAIDAPYFNEASELNYIDGTYYYTYCNDWASRDGWAAEGYDGIDAPPACSMAYMTTKTPLDADSWEYQGAYFYNAGENENGGSGMRWCNNHTHFHEYKGTNYMIHHTMILEELMDIECGFRSLMVETLPINEDGSLPLKAATTTGVDQIKLADAYSEFAGATMFTSADIGFTKGANPNPVSLENGAWTYVKGVDFSNGASSFTATVKGEGFIEIRLDDPSSEAVAKIEFNSNDYVTVTDDTVNLADSASHNVYIVFSSADIELASWQFGKAD